MMWRGILLHFFEDLVDALGVFLGIVEGEMEFRDAAELQAFDDFVANEIGGVFESFDSAFLFSLGTARADQNSSVAHVRRDDDLIND